MKRSEDAKVDGGAIRLNRYLAQCGLGSRRSVERLIVGGRVYVNGERVASMGSMVRPGIDKVEYKGQQLKQVLALEFFAYYKPSGLLVSVDDPHHDQTMYDELERLTGRDLRHLRYVGRLDLNSEGLLLLTNDGSLIHALTHPRYHVRKSYKVCVSRLLEREQAQMMVQQGVESEGDLLKAASVSLMRGGETGRAPWYTVELTEGRKRQIRRMFEYFGVSVQTLVRTRFGGVSLGTLKPGELRELTEGEVDSLRRMGYKRVARTKAEPE